MVKGKKGLGKGIESLIQNQISDMIEESVKEEKPDTYLKVSMIDPNRNQPRKVFDENAMEELSDSIKKYGVIQPLIVRKQGSRYEIIAGERRWRAAKMAGLREVPVIIKNYTDQEIVEISLIENIQRENLNPIEEALAYQTLIKEFHLRQEDVAVRVSKSRTFITNTMRLLKLDERVQNMLSETMITSGHARALLAIENHDLQYETAMRVYDEGMSVRDVEKLVKRLSTPQNRQKEELEHDNHEQYRVIYENAENRLKSIMGTKVNIKNKKDNKGKIEIEYYSLEELERIMELFDRIQQK